ncbi:hypothetical protein MSG28_010308 [Choristoneura fumiferana]|uniref:Uncharacterized protein n=1 Tax=Choristoneura fumiferana TaxID=7141 RepID=A0ACC0KKF9_CHOFU|nr:hypothetical protein MSG28_010308 [Choristoneura fumiferana]
MYPRSAIERFMVPDDKINWHLWSRSPWSLGPNHAADPVVTRWKRLLSGELELDKTTKVIQVNGPYQGMVDPGEKVTTTAVREFQEEAINSSGDVVGALKLNAGDDAVGVQWVDAAHDIKLLPVMRI